MSNRNILKGHFLQSALSVQKRRSFRYLVLYFSFRIEFLVGLRISHFRLRHEDAPLRFNPKAELGPNHRLHRNRHPAITKINENC